MDLGAYAQIENLKAIAKQNNINIPRIRGYRLMKDESPVSDNEIKDMVEETFCNVVESIITTEYFCGLKTHSFFSDEERKIYFELDENGEPIRFNWNSLSTIHGKKRRDIKIEYYLNKKSVERQWKIWNKYTGRPDILYIHAKQGRTNWSGTTWENLKKKKWFLEAVDDGFDSCYCDIYAKIGEK